MARTAIIVGAGVIGVCSAYALASRGWNVTLIDRESGPAMGTSHANGAQLSYCFTDALGRPEVLGALPRFLWGQGGVTFGVSLRPDYLAWLAQFARNCSAARFRENTLAVLALAAQSRAAMESLCAHHDLQFGHRVAGKIHLLYSAKDIETAEKLRAIKHRAGCEQQLVPRADFTALDPALGGLDRDVVAAISTPSELVGDPLLFSRALLEVLIAEYGVKTHFDADVAAIGGDGGQASASLASGEQLNSDLVVVASGIDSNRLLAPLGEAAPIQPMKGYSFEMPLTPGSPALSVTDARRRLVFTNLGDRMRVAGVAELGNWTRTIDAERIAWLIDAARECLPEGGDYTEAGKFWTGLRPTSPHSQPIIRRASRTLAINTGHGALGWTLAMGSGERLADLLTE
ncbi:FAD-dependent oxidoreductase [Qipengyuania sp. ASV99]|uniref:FAD-dependent oxidoreductase n=1 Tax=Qipengyuania sp. ASV99 TaxID=3399681 RepID=UPI003A4C707E